MNEDADKEFVAYLAQMMKKLLEENLLKNPDDAAGEIQKAKSLKTYLEQMGFLVKWEAILNSQTLTCTVKVSVYKAKENMTPEEAAVYNEWFMKHWRIKPPEFREEKQI